MVKIGFIVEGDTESIIVNSPAFIAFLRTNNFELVTPVIDAKGGGNLLPKYVDNFVARLRNVGAERICILTDLEDAASVADVRARIAIKMSTSRLSQSKQLRLGFLPIQRQ